MKFLVGLLSIAAVEARLVGYGIEPYRPVCAFSCLRSLSSYMLVCSETDMMDDGMSMSTTSMTTAQCYANDTSYLTSLAWCVASYCAAYSDVTTADREQFWEDQASTDKAAQPKWGYTEALQQVAEAPTAYVPASTDDTLNYTGLVPASTWQAQYNVLWSVQNENEIESRYSIVLIVLGFAVPLLVTWVGYVPFVAVLFDRWRPALVYSSTVGTYSVRPLPHMLGHAPTRGHALWMAAYLVVNVVLAAVHYVVMLPSAWYSNTWQVVVAFVFYRTGVFGFVMLPLLLLFSSRNNVLLWLTNWSHSTYLLLHRWVARLFVLYAVLHSVLAVLLWKAYGTFESEEKTTLWIWGIVATLCAVLLGVGSGLYIRRPAYEVFLASHIVLSVFVIAGCWYHIYYWSGVSLTWGYETWLYAAIAVWAFDRLARIVRLGLNGVRRATVTALDNADCVRIDIPGVRWGAEPGKHAYVHFPTLTPLRPWENHPFSIVPMQLLQPGFFKTSSSVVPQKQVDVDDVAHASDSLKAAALSGSGITLFVKKAAGMTRHLHAQSQLLTLLDGPYPSGSVREVLRCDRLLLIGGGVGVTSLLSWAVAHWNVKLAWSVRESAQCLMHELQGFLDGVAEKEVRVGGRLDVRALLAREAETGWESVGVVVCGPAGLCDDVRAAVCGTAGKTVFQLEVDAYSW